MKAGANFASSPARILIDFKDPLVVAEKIAKTDSNKFVSIKDIADDLRAEFNLKLPIVSGGNSSSIYLIDKGELPKGKNDAVRFSRKLFR